MPWSIRNGVLPLVMEMMIAEVMSRMPQESHAQTMARRALRSPSAAAEGIGSESAMAACESSEFVVILRLLLFHPHLVRDPVDLPGPAPVLRERLLEVGGSRCRPRPEVADEDHSA